MAERHQTRRREEDENPAWDSGEFEKDERKESAREDRAQKLQRGKIYEKEEMFV